MFTHSLRWGLQQTAVVTFTSAYTALVLRDLCSLTVAETSLPLAVLTGIRGLTVVHDLNDANPSVTDGGMQGHPKFGFVPGVSLARTRF